MGWCTLEGIKESAGITGDEAWDLAGKKLEKLRKDLDKMYEKYFGRKVNQAEFESIVTFAMGGMRWDKIWDMTTGEFRDVEP